ncbi:MAG TPA: S-adenosylmethionine:tRNA ribosyltransferase-isomerase, partial [Thermomicrobiales bacterium]|nr:S-adenosylmethionine:tRNA ribosyltransferase-isomerase [Thermomicrobiales bacterium]
MTDPASNLLVSDFDYELPPELIAQTPLAERDRSRLLVLDRTSGFINHSSIQDLPDWLRTGDLLVANNSRVIPARLHARRDGTGGRVELLLLHRDDAAVWTALARPARRLHPGDRLVLAATAAEGQLTATLEILERRENGMILLRFLDHAEDRLEELGTVPLPPYIRTALNDPERYQTIYATVPGSAAAPTAGL